MSISVYTPDSTKILHTAYADFASRQIGRPVHVVQYDSGLPILAVKLFNDGQPYTIPSNASVNIRLGKSDGTFVHNPALGCDSTRKTAYFELTYQMVILAGTVSPVVEIVIDGDVSCTSSINIIIDRNPVQRWDVESTSEWKAIEEAVGYSKEAIAAAASAQASRNAALTSEQNALRYKNDCIAQVESIQPIVDQTIEQARNLTTYAANKAYSAEEKLEAFMNTHREVLEDLEVTHYYEASIEDSNGEPIRDARNDEVFSVQNVNQVEFTEMVADEAKNRSIDAIELAKRCMEDLITRFSLFNRFPMSFSLTDSENEPILDSDNEQVNGNIIFITM